MNKNCKLILILIDDRGQFQRSVKEIGGSFDLKFLMEEFIELGYSPVMKGFSEIDFKYNIYKDFYVIYQVTEDPDLKYKDYIEDILLGLELSGSIILPNFMYFRAHHNKVFMEILRLKLELDNKLSFSHFGSLEELINSKRTFTYPLVLKPSAGSKSKGVSLVYNERELLQCAKKISKTFTLVNITRFFYFLFNGLNYKPISNYRNKFIVQEFIPKLLWDYKILIYDCKYYIVKRENRPQDFRASGSGLLSFPNTVPDDILNFAELIFAKTNSPFMGMDIAISKERFYLMEFQFVGMGNYAIEKSPFYFTRRFNNWVRVDESSLLEHVYVESIDSYIINSLK